MKNNRTIYSVNNSSSKDSGMKKRYFSPNFIRFFIKAKSVKNIKMGRSNVKECIKKSGTLSNLVENNLNLLKPTKTFDFQKNVNRRIPKIPKNVRQINKNETNISTKRCSNNNSNLSCSNSINRECNKNSKNSENYKNLSESFMPIDVKLENIKKRTRNLLMFFSSFTEGKV